MLVLVEGREKLHGLRVHQPVERACRDADEVIAIFVVERWTLNIIFHRVGWREGRRCSDFVAFRPRSKLVDPQGIRPLDSRRILAESDTGRVGGGVSTLAKKLPYA